ncbi:hypothetical protein AVEN_27086-1 [Araneus ventricosus]|uniref:Uncharacterized protein n=1 Tax=Araneus ventricosus TaxID=182803 RepID=A0A4Y2W970_ARAVE|nr:hypothetical protein AVEN_45155-1 [Araneus ventricosus]GBO33985.1 hypothetical protein AVEN_27086-1 [Araneus ventricosus]
MAGLSSPISTQRSPLMTTVYSHHSEQQAAETRLTSIEVIWPVTAGLGVRRLNHTYGAKRSPVGVEWEIGVPAQMSSSSFD